MATIKEILIYTYQLTFNNEIDYDWMAIAEIIVVSDNVEEELYALQLVNNKESKEDLLYWQDLFFMEIAEQGSNFNEDDSFLLEKINKNSLFKENAKFISQLPKVATDFGRELLIDNMIDNEDADKLIPDHLIEKSLKKKSREDLRKEFENWNEETIPESKTAAYANNRKSFKLVKFLIAACLVGVIVTIGYNTLNKNKYSFESNSYVTTTEKTILKDNGLGFVDKESTTSIVIQILNYGDAITADPKVSDKLILNSYLFLDKKLKLVLLNNAVDVKLIELDKNELYLSYNDDFYSIESSKNYKKLEKLYDKNIMKKLDRIIFENE